MPHQGNIYLGYNLVLLVQPPPLQHSETQQLNAKVAVRAIKAHIRLHLFCRFCKKLPAKFPKELELIFKKRIKIRAISQKKITDLNRIHQKHPCIYVLVDTGNNSKVGTGSLCSFADVQKRLRKIDPEVHVELFRINQPSEPVACEDVLKRDDIHDPQLLYDDNLYHLASRVCASFVEYCFSWNNAQHEQEYFVGGEDLKFLDIQKFDIKNLAGKTPKLSDSTTVVKKIIDIKDAVDLLCASLDGAMHYFPPVSDSLEHIFAGKDTVDSVWVRYKFPFGIWFRGSPRVCYDLKPSLFRYNPALIMHPGCKKRVGERVVVFDECSMVHHFREYLPSFKREYGAMFDWLCLMQHHNAPTRLLDWTENILLALYFAVRDREADCDAAVWVLNAGRLNEITRVSSTRRYICFPSSTDVHLRTAMAVSHTWGELRRNLLKLGLLREVVDALREDDRETFKWLLKDPNYEAVKARDCAICQKKGLRHLTFREKLQYPVAVYPSRVNERLAAQLGTFTLHGGKSYDPVLSHNFSKGRFENSESLIDLNKKVLGKEIEGKPFLDVFVVPSGAKRKIREQLKRLGVHAAAVFPELDYQSDYMKREWMIPNH